MGRIAANPNSRQELLLAELRRQLGDLERSVASIRLEPRHVVGDPGEPAFQNAYTVLDARTPVGFYKETFRTGAVTWSRVRLVGGAFVNGSASGSTVFTLPVSHRPTQLGFWPSPCASGDLAAVRGVVYIQVTTSGVVSAHWSGAGSLILIGFDHVNFFYQEPD